MLPLDKIEEIRYNDNKVSEHCYLEGEAVNMAHGTYDDTHQKILESGMKMFLANGYERTNLRDLCADAGITTGSLYRHFESKADLFSFFVQPAVDEIRKLFFYVEPLCQEAVEAGDPRALWSIVGADKILDYTYRHFDALKLLLECSDGTQYSSFLNDVVGMEADISMRCFKAAKEQGMISGDLPSEIEMHMISHAYISCLFEAVLHDLNREDMEKYVSTIVEIFTAGAFKILGL